MKEWTLPLAMGAGTVVYLLFDRIPALDAPGDALAPFIAEILPLFIFVILFLTFCKVDFQRLRPVTWHWRVALFQLLLIFALVGAVLLWHIEGKHLILMEAALTCVIAPCAAAAAVVTDKLGGSLEELTTYTFLSNFLTAILVPVCFPLVDHSVDMSFLQAFLLIFYKVSLVLIMPMLLAYIVKHYMHRLHRWLVSLKDLGFYLWGCSLSIVTGTTVKNIVHADTTVSFLLLIAFLCLILCLLQFAVGRGLGHSVHRTQEAGQALGQKNTAFAIWIASTYLNPLSSVGPGCYILWQNIVNSIELWQKEHQSETACKR